MENYLPILRDAIWALLFGEFLFTFNGFKGANLYNDLHGFLVSAAVSMVHSCYVDSCPIQDKSRLWVV